MAEQSWALTGSVRDRDENQLVVRYQHMSGEVIQAAFVPPGAEFYIGEIGVRGAAVSVRIANVAGEAGAAGGQDLSDRFEADGIVRLTFGSRVVNIPMSASDDLVEPYLFDVSGQLETDLRALVMAMAALPQSQYTALSPKTVTFKLDLEPQQFTDLEVAVTARRRADVSWTIPEGSSTATAVHLERRTGETGAWVRTTLAGDATERTLTGLAHGTTYQVRVRGTNADGDGEWTEPVEFRTLPANQPPTVVVHTENRAVGGREEVRLVASVEDVDSLDDPPAAPTVRWRASPNLGTIDNDRAAATVYTAPDVGPTVRVITLTCTGTDDEGATASDTVTIEVRSSVVEDVARYLVKITRDRAPVRHMGQDLTSWLLAPLEWRQGREYGSQTFPRALAGAVTLKAINDGGEWDGIESRDDIEISMTVDGANGPLWTGFIDVVEDDEDREDKSILILRCLGNLARLLRNKITIRGQRAVGTRSAMHQVFTAAGVPERYWGDIDDTETIDWFYAQNESPLAVARKIEVTAKGFLFEDRQGRISLQSFQRRAETVPSLAVPGFHKFKYTRTQERDYVAFEGIPTYLSLSGERVLWSINEQNSDLPQTIPAGATRTFFGAVPNPNAQTGIIAVNSVVSPDPYPFGDYRATGSLDIVASAGPTGISVVITNPHERPTTLRAVSVVGTAWEVTDGEVVRRASVPIRDDLEFATLPPHYLSSRAKMIEAMNILIGFGAEGQQVHTLDWIAGEDYVRAQDLEISQILPVRTRRVNSAFIVEGMKHRVWNGAYHQVTLTLTEAGPYEGLFFADISLADGPDRTP